MFIKKFMVSQLRHPRGISSGFVARGMNRTNADTNTMTIQLLEIKSTDYVLEIGFGGGDAIEKMIELTQNGLVAGIDISRAMLRQGKRKFKKSISQGKVEIKEGSASKIPYEDGFFDKICTINCLYFWFDPMADLKEILRVLKPGGTFILTVYQKKELENTPAARYGFTLYSEDQLKNMLYNAGFSSVRIERRKGKPMTSVYAIGTRAG